MSSRTPHCPGVYAPALTFNPDTEDLDPAATRTHTVCLAKASLASLVTMVSNGEAVHLFSAERQTVIRETCMALADASFANVPVIAGASEQSIRGTIELCHESASAGTEYSLIVPPSYYRTAMCTDEVLYA